MLAEAVAVRAPIVPSQQISLGNAPMRLPRTLFGSQKRRFFLVGVIC
jgi:hypothetical protein